MTYDPNPTIECPDCDGEGEIWNNADPTSGQSVECDACHGEGWREPTDAEAADIAEAAWEALCAEPPMSFSERCEMNALRDAAWEV